MFEHDLEKIGSAVSKHSENIKGFGFLAKNLPENPKKLAGLKPQEPQLFGCMAVIPASRNVHSEPCSAPALHSISTHQRLSFV